MTLGGRAERRQEVAAVIPGFGGGDMGQPEAVDMERSGWAVQRSGLGGRLDLGVQERWMDGSIAQNSGSQEEDCAERGILGFRRLPRDVLSKGTLA